MTKSASTSIEIRALVVDDNVEAATSLSHLLQVLECKSAMAFDGLAGLRVAQVFQPNLVIADYEMPGLDGIGAVRQLRGLGGALGETVCVCLTGCCEPELEAKCLAAGFNRFVTKPIEIGVLHSLLEEVKKQAANHSSAAASQPT